MLYDMDFGTVIDVVCLGFASSMVLIFSSVVISERLLGESN